MKNIHCIPVGNDEPIHECHTLCWCHPVKDVNSVNLYIHNAMDCREKWERQGIKTAPDSLWVTMVERLNKQEEQPMNHKLMTEGCLGPIVWRIGWDAHGHWITGKHGHTNHLWLWLGPTRSQDKLTIYNLVIGPIGIAIGWRGWLNVKNQAP